MFLDSLHRPPVKASVQNHGFSLSPAQWNTALDPQSRCVVVYLPYVAHPNRASQCVTVIRDMVAMRDRWPPKMMFSIPPDDLGQCWVK